MTEQKAMVQSKGDVPALPQTKLEQQIAYSNNLSKSDIVPKAFQGKPANCFLMVDYADTTGLSVLGLMQSAFIAPGGGLAFKTEFYIARVRMLGLILGSPEYETIVKSSKRLENPGGGELDDIEVMCTMTSAEEDKHGEPRRISEKVSMRTARAEGWTRRSQKRSYMPNKYETIGPRMLGMRAAGWLIRSYFSEVLMGGQTAGEVNDVRTAETVIVDEQTDAGISRLRTAPGARVVEVETVQEDPEPDLEPVTEGETSEAFQGNPASVSEAEQEVRDPDPGGLTEKQINALLDWMIADSTDAAAIHHAIRNAYGRESVEGLTEAEAGELLEQIESGDFAMPLEDLDMS